ncbi:HAD family hydrolase [Niveibacterium sp. SC-1]|uniref:HAD family hydrolase n=1 Tax=Niveibacterium sp. SC-1 TaxID=3135646 RepID=UPI00311E8F3D
MSISRSLYVSDLDYTLLDASGYLSDRSLAALSRWIGEGLQFTVASARAPTSIREGLRGLPLTLPVISMNGACITDLASGRHLEIRSLTRELAQTLLDELTGAGLNPLIISSDGEHDAVRFTALANAGITGYVRDRQALGDTRLRLDEAPECALDETVIGLTLILEAARAGAAVALLRERHGERIQCMHMTATHQPGFHWISITAPGVNKGSALARLRERCGANVSVFAYGDDVQDVSLLTAADRAVAVANAKPAVRAVAHEHTEAHHEDGVVRHIARRLGHALGI